jgi:hypothetical protein
MSSSDSVFLNPQKTIDYLEHQGHRAERDEALARRLPQPSCSRSSMRETE